MRCHLATEESALFHAGAAEQSALRAARDKHKSVLVGDKHVCIASSQGGGTGKLSQAKCKRHSISIVLSFRSYHNFNHDAQKNEVMFACFAAVGAGSCTITTHGLANLHLVAPRPTGLHAWLVLRLPCRAQHKRHCTFPHTRYTPPRTCHISPGYEG